MDKKGDPIYLRIPLTLDALVEKQARKEGRSKNEMIIHLIARGIHLSDFDVEQYTSNFFELEGQNCREK
jgi:hypothetical protein